MEIFLRLVNVWLPNSIHPAFWECDLLPSGFGQNHQSLPDISSLIFYLVLNPAEFLFPGKLPCDSHCASIGKPE